MCWKVGLLGLSGRGLVGPRTAGYSHKQKSARPIETERRSINELRKQVGKFDAKIVRRGNYIIFQMAEAAPWSIHRRRRGD